MSLLVSGCIEIWGFNEPAFRTPEEEQRRLRSIRAAERTILVIVELVIWYAAVTCNLALLKWVRLRWLCVG